MDAQKEITQRSTACPLGQRLLRAGFRWVTEAEICQLLRCEEIQRLEIGLLKQQKLDQMQERHPGRAVAVEWDPPDYLAAWWRVLGCWCRDYKISGVGTICVPKYVQLENYVEQDIPERVLARIAAARDLGLQNFCVVYPVLRPAGDPVVVGVLDDKEHMVLIAQWG